VPEPALVGVRVGDRPAAVGAGRVEVPHGGYLAARFAAPYYEGTLGYQMRLNGRDEVWREPQVRNEFVLAGLDAGTYTLEVRAVVPGSDRASPPAALPFTVARPWYRSWWAPLLALAVLGGVAWTASTVMSHRSLRTEQRLRALVDARTDELSRANRLLAEHNAEMERFLYTVSHDLKSPLISISGFMGLLERDLERGELSGAGDYVERVKASSARMATLLDELLEMSRIGRVKEEPERVESGALASEVLEEMSARFAERGVAVSVSPNMPTVHAHRSRLRQVVQNLLDNALKFLGDQDRPRVELGGHAEDGRAHLFVRDNGVGIDPAHHEAAFELFRRLHRDSEGTGVGLSLVKRIVEVQGGRVWIESDGQPGRGTTVWLELPRWAEDRDP
jgi:signal transduction histidine kinase